ncbi:MAG: glycosyltransferase family 39 protein [Planctomycetota bacterium]|nr:glycosyltransferase family 39 protein [Planctomycetota bacterium]
MPHPRFHGWIVAGVAGIVLLTRLGATPLWDDDEPKNAACSVAMLDSNDWVVPTFDGRLRIEKPPLVNWLHIAGMTVCGRTETGVRIGSVVLTIGTCLLTWRLGVILFSPAVGLLGGIVMATCIWTTVGGRASTPDAPLVFFTTLTLFCFARESARVGSGRDDVRLSLWGAIAIGATCGAAVLAKGPIGFVIPAAACVAFTVVRGWSTPRPSLREMLAGLRPLTVTATMLAVALPWYAWVTIRTDGEWLRGFFLVHNVGRFAAPMEGHSGSLAYYPIVIGIGLFPWSLVLVAMLVNTVATLRHTDHPQRVPMQLLACWAGAWVGILSLAGTKLPGYVWPAYPALALATACFLDAWQRGAIGWLAWSRRPQWAAAIIMQIGFAVVLASGAAIAIALSLVARRWAPGAEWMGMVGLVPMLGAAFGWRATLAGRPRETLAAIAASGGLLCLLLAAVVAPQIGQAATPQSLFLQARASTASLEAVASFRRTPPSIVFYAGVPLQTLETPDDVTRHLTTAPDARLIVSSHLFDELANAIPASHGVVAETRTVSARHLLLIGPLSPHRLAARTSLRACRLDGRHQFRVVR